MRDFIFGLFGGAALLMYGVDMMGDGLERCAGNTMKSILSALTGTIYRAIAVSTVLTALVQSSTAITVLTVGFVNAGLMSLTQAVGIIYGANIGTTITAQLMAFKLTDYAMLFVAVGFAVKLMAKIERIRYFGAAVMGFGLMFTGLRFLQSGVPFLQQSEGFRSALLYCSQTPLLAVLIGAVGTMMVQSSSATVALTMVLAKAGLIDLTGAVCLMLGDNIGTCVTAQIASLNTSINARRTAWAHSLYNVIGVLGVLIILPYFVRLTAGTAPGDISRQIANSHTVFNVLSAVVFLPFTRQYVRFLETVVKGRTVHNKTHLDELLLDTPAAALQAVRAELGHASRMLKDMLEQSFGLIAQYDENVLVRFDENEQSLNAAHKNITSYIMELTRRPMSERESRWSTGLLQVSNMVERIGDHFEEVTHLATRKSEENAEFSVLALDDMAKLKRSVMDLLTELPRDLADAEFNVDELSKTIYQTCQDLRQNHIARLSAGKCTVDAGVIYFDIISHVESIVEYVADISSKYYEMKFENAG